MQLMVAIQAHEDNHPAKNYTKGLPDYALIKAFSDNISANKWIKNAAAYSVITRNLLEIYAVLLQRTTLRFDSNHIAGKDNYCADLTSHPSPNSFTNLSLFYEQLFLKLPYLRSYDTFHLHQETCYLLSSALSSNVRIWDPVIPKLLGSFKPGSSFISNSYWNAV